MSRRRRRIGASPSRSSWPTTTRSLRATAIPPRDRTTFISSSSSASWWARAGAGLGGKLRGAHAVQAGMPYPAMPQMEERYGRLLGGLARRRAELRDLIAERRAALERHSTGAGAVKDSVDTAFRRSSAEVESE